MPPKRRVPETPVTRTASGTQDPSGAGKTPFKPRPTASRGITAPSTKDLPLPEEIEKEILEQQKKKREQKRRREIAARAASKRLDSEAAEPAAAGPAPAPASRSARAGKRPAQPTAEQQIAAANLEVIGAAVIAPVIAPGACPLAGAGPIVIEDGEHYDPVEYTTWLQENNLMDDGLLAQFRIDEQDRIDAINEANKDYSIVERKSSVRQELNASAELMVRQLAVNSISKRLIQLTTGFTYGSVLYSFGVHNYINDIIDDIIVGGSVAPEFVLDILASIRSNRIPDIAVGGALESETVMQVAGTLNGMALIRFVMNMNEELLNDLTKEQIEATDPSDYNIVKQLTDSNLPLEQQLEIIKGFILNITNDLIARGVNLAEGISPYHVILDKLGDFRFRKSIRDNAFEYVRTAITNAARLAQDEANLRSERARMALRQADPSFQRTDETDAVVRPSARASSLSFGRHLVESVAAGTLGLTIDLVKVAFLGSPPDPSGALHRAYHFLSSGVYNLYAKVCPGRHERAVDEAFQQLVLEEQEKIATELTGPEIAAIEETPGSARALEIQTNPEMSEEEKLARLKDLEEFLESQANPVDSQVAFQGSQPLNQPGGGRKRKHTSTRSSTSSKSSKSGTRKHGKSKRVKKGGAKTRHMRLAPGAGRRTRKHSKRGRK